MKIKIKNKIKEQIIFEQDEETQQFLKKIAEMDKKTTAVFDNVIGTGLYDVVKDAEGAFGFGKDGKQGNFQAGLNFIKATYNDVVIGNQKNKFDTESANLFIDGLKEILQFYKKKSLSALSESSEGISEAFGMKNKAIDSLVASLKEVPKNNFVPAPATVPQAADTKTVTTQPAIPTVDADPSDVIDINSKPEETTDDFEEVPIPLIKTDSRTKGETPLYSSVYSSILSTVYGGKTNPENKKEISMLTLAIMNDLSSQLKVNGYQVTEEKKSRAQRISDPQSASSKQLRAFTGGEGDTSTTATGIKTGSINVTKPVMIRLSRAGFSQQQAAKIRNLIVKKLKKLVDTKTIQINEDLFIKSLDETLFKYTNNKLEESKLMNKMLLVAGVIKQ